MGAPHGPPRSFFRFGFLFAVKTGFFRRHLKSSPKKNGEIFDPKDRNFHIARKYEKCRFFGKNPRFAYREIRNGEERNWNQFPLSGIVALYQQNVLNFRRNRDIQYDMCWRQDSSPEKDG